MSEFDDFKSRYKYSLRLESGGQVLAQSTEMTQKDIQEFVNISLGLMTGGCEQCLNNKGLYCEKLGRPLKPQEARCEHFKQRPSAAFQY
jgi:hypothetical protein